MTDSLTIARTGLPDMAGARKNILILGAGIAGLIAAHELQKQGHNVSILEARSRPGGRIHTLRAPFAPGLHGEAGAMRIPASHELTIHYVRRFGLELMPFTMNNDRGYYLLQNQKIRIGDAVANPELLPYSFAESAQGKTIQSMWQATIRPLVDIIRNDRKDGWARVQSEVGFYSLRQFLEIRGWSEDAIELYSILENQEAEMDISILEILLEEASDYYRDLYQIKGGMDRLVYAAFEPLRERVRFGAVVRAIDQNAQGVAATFQTAAGRFTERADYMICTIPFAVLRHIDILQPFSRAKQKAIRALHYHPSGKIFLQAARRFWETDDGIRGGSSLTDLPIRSLYYPEHGQETGRGVLIASYTWGEDANRWSSLPEAERIREAIEHVAKIHPQMPREFEAGASAMWHEDPFAGGAYALFEPEQDVLLAAASAAPEGRIHFAGEHVSGARAWIQGAIDSGLRAALAVHEA